MPREATSLPRSFHALIAGQGISQFGDKIYLLALSWWVMETTRSATKMGLVLGLAVAANVLCGFFAGALADRWNRKRILVAMDLLRGLLVLGVGLALHFQALTLPWVILSEILVAAMGALFDATLPAMIPEVVGEAQLSKANGRRAFLAAFASIGGPVLGGVLASRWGCEATVLLNALSYFIAAAATAFVAYRAGEPGAHASQGLREGYAYLFSRRSLVNFLGIVAVLHVFAGSMQVVVPVLASAIRGSRAANIGLLQTSLGLGEVAMALGLGVLSLRGRELPALLAGVTGLGLGYLAMAGLLAAGAGPWAHAAAFAACSACLVAAATAYQTYLQSSVDNAMAGRVFGIVNSVGASTMAASILGFGACAERFGLGPSLGVSGLLMAALAGLFLLGTRTPEPAPAGD